MVPSDEDNESSQGSDDDHSEANKSDAEAVSRELESSAPQKHVRPAKNTGHNDVTDDIANNEIVPFPAAKSDALHSPAHGRHGRAMKTSKPSIGENIPTSQVRAAKTTCHDDVVDDYTDDDVVPVTSDKPNNQKSSAPDDIKSCLLYTSPSPRDLSTSRMPSSA